MSGIDPLGNVGSWNGRTGAVVMELADVLDAGGAPIDSPYLQGNARAPTVTLTDSSNAIATTEFVKNVMVSSSGGDGSMPGTLQAVPPTTGSLLITCEYNPVGWGADEGVVPGMAWCIMHDNPVYAWLVDTSRQAPIYPVILGTLPDWTPPDTGEVLSPRWAVREADEVFIADMARGDAHAFFNFIAFNNGAQRPIYAKFADSHMAVSWNQWKNANPNMWLAEPPNVEPGADAASLSFHRRRHLEPAREA